MTKKNIATILCLLLVLICLALRVTRVVRGSEPDQLIGSWSLVSRQTTLADGKVVGDPGLSAVPKGILIYDRSGHVAAQLSRPGRTVEMLASECADAEKVKGTGDTAQTILGYDAYF